MIFIQCYYLVSTNVATNEITGGCRIITPLNFIDSLNQGCVWGNSPYEKLRNHLENKEKCN